jgi:hypothetical protein
MVNNNSRTKSGSGSSLTSTLRAVFKTCQGNHPDEKKRRQYSLKKKIGSGEFGSVFTVDASPDIVIKINNITNKEEEEAFDRELHYLHYLKKDHLKYLKVLTVPPAHNDSQNKSNLKIPVLYDSWRCRDSTSQDKYGIQILERFDGSVKQLGLDQAENLRKHLRLDQKHHETKGDVWAFTEEQLKNIIDLGKFLDNHQLIHGDAKLANLLFKYQYKNKNKSKNRYKVRLVLADFGFTGEERSNATYAPLMGFTGPAFDCNADQVERDAAPTRPQSRFTRAKTIHFKDRKDRNNDNNDNYSDSSLSFLRTKAKSKSKSKSDSSSRSGSISISSAIPKQKQKRQRVELKNKIDPVLLPKWNRIQLFLNLSSRTVYKIVVNNRLTTPITTFRMTPEELLKLFGLYNVKIINTLNRYCPNIPGFLKHIAQKNHLK